MRTADPSIFTQLVAHVMCNASNHDTYLIGTMSTIYDEMDLSEKEICRKIVFEEFNFTENSFKGWHQDNLDSFSSYCAMFVGYIITFYIKDIKVDRVGFYKPSGLLSLGKSRLSQKDLWNYYEKFEKDRERHPCGNWRNIAKEYDYPLNL